MGLLGVDLALVLCFTLAQLTGASSILRRNSTGLTNAVTWDSHSLFIQGQRVFILSGEFHPWRVPNPDLWQDVFQKIHDNGFNTVSFYIDWALHYPTPTTNAGNGDWEPGTYRDIQAFIDGAKNAGLWLIARPGPYINAETSGGGFPGWVSAISGSLRTNNAAYEQAYAPYLTQAAKLIAKNQITNGGPVILVQAENEFSAGGSHDSYVQNIIDIYRNNGITIRNFSPDLPGAVHVNIYCGDSYPQSSSWAQVQAVYYSDHMAVAPSNPMCLAEFGGGWLLGWGSVSRGKTGYEKYTNDLSGPLYENVFYKENIAQTATIMNIYMLFGGTNWGQTAEPTVYTSYDYGAGINENRVVTPKMNEMRQQGLFLRVSRDLFGATLIANGTNYTSSNLVHTAELRNLDTGAAFYVIRHQQSTSTALTSTKLNVTTLSGPFTIPRSGNLTLNGRESKIIVTDYVFGIHNTRVIYSTAEIMTWTTIDQTDYITLYLPSGQSAEVLLTFSAAPTAVLSYAPGVVVAPSGNSLLVNVAVGATSLWVPITAGGQTIAMVAFMNKAVAGTWHAPLIPGTGAFGNYFSIGTNQTVLVGGPYVVRSASITGGSLLLSGDTNGTTSVELIAPSSVQSVSWNGVAQSTSRTGYGSLLFSTGSNLTVALPDLSKLTWKMSGSLPEVQPTFDDSNFTMANQTSTNFTNLPTLAGSNVLYSQQYGFYGGNLLWRGHFNASGSETGVNLTVLGGNAFAYSVWLNGIFLGSNEATPSVSSLTDTWSFPNGSVKAGHDNVLAVLQDHMGNVESSSNGGKEPRGIRGYQLLGAKTTFSHWMLQGNEDGAANTPDTIRGYLNEGGLYAERIGAHLPGFPDASWQVGSPLTHGVQGAGVNFYRSTFSLVLPSNADVPIRLSFTPSPQTVRYRAQIYLNGWMLGKYINDVGPQTVFVLPAGILRSQSPNTLALSLWSLDNAGASLAGLTLVADGVFETDPTVVVSDYTMAPDYAAQQNARPPALPAVQLM